MQRIYVSAYYFELVFYLLERENGRLCAHFFEDSLESLRLVIGRHRIGYEETYQYPVLDYYLLETEGLADVSYLHDLEKVFDLGRESPETVFQRRAQTLYRLLRLQSVQLTINPYLFGGYVNISVRNMSGLIRFYRTVRDKRSGL